MSLYDRIHRRTKNPEKEKPAKKKATKIEDEASSDDPYERAGKVRAKEKNESQIILYRRSQNEYGRSAYSFRYRTQEKNKHRNYVDLVYSADGKLRINNHASMKARITKLGSDASLVLDKDKLKKASWTNKNLNPESGMVLRHSKSKLWMSGVRSKK